MSRAGSLVVVKGSHAHDTNLRAAEAILDSSMPFARASKAPTGRPTDHATNSSARGWSTMPNFPSPDLTASRTYDGHRCP